MSSKGLCQTWSGSSSVSALGVFLGSSKPPIRLLLSLHSTCRDVRRTLSDSPNMQSPVTGSLITSSYKAPRSAASVPADSSSHNKLLRLISAGQLEMAMEQVKLLQSRGSHIEPHSFEQLIEGLSDAYHIALLDLWCYVQHTLMYVCSLAKAADVSRSASCVQVFSATSSLAIALLHLPVTSHGCNQGKHVGLSVCGC